MVLSTKLSTCSTQTPILMLLKERHVLRRSRSHLWLFGIWNTIGEVYLIEGGGWKEATRPSTGAHLVEIGHLWPASEGCRGWWALGMVSLVRVVVDQLASKLARTVVATQCWWAQHTLLVSWRGESTRPNFTRKGMSPHCEGTQACGQIVLWCRCAVCTSLIWNWRRKHSFPSTWQTDLYEDNDYCVGLGLAWLGFVPNAEQLWFTH